MLQLIHLEESKSTVTEKGVMEAFSCWRLMKTIWIDPHMDAVFITASFMKHLAQHCVHLEELDVSWVQDCVDDETIVTCATAWKHSLKRLLLHASESISTQGLRDIVQVCGPVLEALSLTCCANMVDSRSFEEALVRCPNLVDLSINSSMPYAARLTLSPEGPVLSESLTELNVNSLLLADDFLTAVKNRLPKVRSLTATHSGEIFPELPEGWTSLEELGGCYRTFRPGAIQALVTTCPNLKIFSAQGVNISDLECLHLAMPSLKVTGLSFCEGISATNKALWKKGTPNNEQ